MVDLAVIILTFNEDIHLDRALNHISTIAREVFVIDSFSTDCTVAIAQARGTVVMQNKFINQAKQFQWALDNAPIKAAWVMRLDADEIVNPDLAQEINRVLPQLPLEITGITLNRKTIFMDRWIRYGGRYPLILLRIWRNGFARVEERWMDEHILLSEGKAILLKGGFSDHNLNNLSFFIDKHNKYATREAVEIVNSRHKLFQIDSRSDSVVASYQANVKRFLKDNVFNSIPFELSSLGYFTIRYVFQLGFLDGRAGLIYHFLQGCWYRFLVGSKVIEYEKALAGLEGRAAREELSRVTGLQLDISSGQSE